MEKLEIEQIAPYSPYGLKWNTKDGNIFSRANMSGYVRNTIVFSYDEESQSIDSSFDLTFTGDERYMPVLRPLSFLVE